MIHSRTQESLIAHISPLVAAINAVTSSETYYRRLFGEVFPLMRELLIIQQWERQTKARLEERAQLIELAATEMASAVTIIQGNGDEGDCQELFAILEDARSDPSPLEVRASPCERSLMRLVGLLRFKVKPDFDLNRLSSADRIGFWDNFYESESAWDRHPSEIWRHLVWVEQLHKLDTSSEHEPWAHRPRRIEAHGCDLWKLAEQQYWEARDSWDAMLFAAEDTEDHPPWFLARKLSEKLMDRLLLELRAVDTAQMVIEQEDPVVEDLVAPEVKEFVAQYLTECKAKNHAPRKEDLEKAYTEERHVSLKQAKRVMKNVVLPRHRGRLPEQLRERELS